MSEQIVAVDNLTKRYHTKIAVDDISFAVRRGEVFGLLGPNGAGKTSTLECIEGIRNYEGGRVSVAGVDIKRNEKAVRKLLGVQLQSSSLPDNIRPYEAMSLICRWHGLPASADLLEKFDLDREPKKQYMHMSTGQKRRLHLALALAAGPAVVVLDEPTAGLDVEGRSQLHRIIHELRDEGTTFLLATHDMAEAEIMCDRIAIMIQGRLAVTGTPAQVTAAGNQETKITIRTLNNTLLPGRDQDDARFTGESGGYGIWMARDISRAVSGLLRQIEDNGDSIIDLRVERPSLEERFLEIVNGGKS